MLFLWKYFETSYSKSSLYQPGTKKIQIHSQIGEPVPSSPPFLAIAAKL